MLFPRSELTQIVALLSSKKGNENIRDEKEKGDRKRNDFFFNFFFEVFLVTFYMMEQVEPNK